MKFEANKPVFLDALQMASNASPTKTTLQILYNLFAEAGRQHFGNPGPRIWT